MGVDSDLARSITREESGFNASIESFANAMGLMQLILPTAKSMAKRSEGVSIEDPSRPDLNVTLGTRYLAHGRNDRSSRHPDSSRYNAGAGRLKKWLKTYGDLPLDLFVERLPYERRRANQASQLH